MSNLSISLIAAFVSILGFFHKPATNYSPATAPMPMCHTEPLTDDMATFVSDPTFQAFHPSPSPLNYEGKGQRITFKTPDGAEAKGYFVKSKKKSKKWLFVYQEWWGLNEYIMRQSDIFYKDLGENVNVLALDMYDGQVTADPKEAGKFMQGVKEERLNNIVKGGVLFAGTKAKIANVGWCFGGGWSLKSALLLEKQAVGSVMYYGMPVKDVEKLKTLNCDVLGLFATEKFISKEIIEEFAANMKKADKKLEYKIFDGVHGFANPSNPKYDEALSKEAYGMALGYLKNRLKVK
ncbi:MAG: dienelactone hydrolase family protein [Saprospiraceae bacterium]|nr:dienelactone hydrolase family protein [Saprospiraceae bacterium]